jgi:superfamily II DNA helicase RecQ
MGYERLRINQERINLTDEELSAFDTLARRSRLERRLVITTLDIFYDSQQNRIDTLEDHINDPDSTTLHDVDRSYATAAEAVREVAVAALRSPWHRAEERVELMTDLFISASTYQQPMLAKYDIETHQYNLDALRHTIAELYMNNHRQDFVELVRTEYGQDFSEELDRIMELLWEEPDFAMYHELDRFNETLDNSAELLKQLEKSDDDMTTDRILNQTYRAQLSHMLAMLEALDSVVANFGNHEDRVVYATGMFARLHAVHSSIAARLTGEPGVAIDHETLQQEINDMPQDQNGFTDAVYKKYARMFQHDLGRVRDLYADES